jgi:hypothetical protein
MSQEHQENMKKIFNNRTTERKFLVGDLVLKWDARREAKGKHGKFDNLWRGPFQITIV